MSNSQHIVTLNSQTVINIDPSQTHQPCPGQMISKPKSIFTVSPIHAKGLRTDEDWALLRKYLPRYRYCNVIPETAVTRKTQRRHTALAPMKARISLEVEKSTRIQVNAKDLLLSLRRITCISALNWKFIEFYGFSKYKEARQYHDVTTAIRYLAPLRSMNLSFHECSHLSDQKVRSLVQSLKSLTALSHLTLDFSSCKQIIGKALNLKKTLPHLHLLSEVSLNFSQCSQITYQTVEGIILALSRLTMLTKLNLVFPQFNEEDDIDFDRISRSLSLLTRLSHLDLCLTNYYPMADQDMESLSSSLGVLTQLTTLSLGLVRCSKISQAGFEDLSYALKSLTLLSTLHIDVTGSRGFSRMNVKSLFLSLDHLSLLSNLSLNLRSCVEIDRRAVSTLCSSFEHVKPLKTLTLYLSNLDNGNRFSDPFYGLGHFQSLQALNLCFRNSNINDQDIKNLSSNIKHLTSLATLNIDMNNCTLARDEGLTELAKCLRFLVSLRKFKLNTDWCISFSDTGIKAICTGLARIMSLQVAEIIHGPCSPVKLTEDALSPLKKLLPYVSKAVNGGLVAGAKLSRVTLALYVCLM